jgi:hypothetical protein
MSNGMNIEFRRHGLHLSSGTASLVEGEKFRSAIGIAGFFAEIQLHNLPVALITIN